jgi:MYXO-CTERM domain-containing protein
MTHPRPRTLRARLLPGLAALGLAGLASLATFMGAPSEAEAFCGFYVAGADAELYNNATMVVMMRDGTRTVLAMQNNYQGPPEDFALVVPVPVVLSEDDVKTLEDQVFDRVDQLAAPRLVEYWEQDPCWEPPRDRYRRRGGRSKSMDMVPMAEEAEAADYGVTIEAEFTVGEYEIVILGAEDSTGLDAWLRDNGYKIPEGAGPVLEPYVQSGMKFFVAKVDAKKVNFNDQGQAMLSPLRFHYDTDQFSLPVRLGLINAKGDQDLLVHILGRHQRYEVANYENVTIPTNLEVKNEVREHFGQFYASLFDHTLAQNPQSVVTEYAWAASSCDPCPVPSLSGQELRVLGADVLPSMSNYFDQQGNLTNEWGVASEFTLTRLHARYDKSSLGEDLVFQEAPPIVGGREFVQQDGVLERGSQPAPGGTDNFQARYIIRHYWDGPVKCANPQFGRWGGPPSGQSGDGGLKVARDLAFVKRDAKLESFVTAAAHEELGLGGAPEAEKIPHAAKRERAASGGGGGGGTSDGGCAHCSTAEQGRWGAALAGAFALFGLAGLIRRRRS